MFIFQFISKLIKILRSSETPAQIAGGFILGMMLGLSPSIMYPINFLIILVLILINVNLASAFFAFAVFSGIAYLMDPAFHHLGFFVLADFTPLNGFFTMLYNIPFLPFTGFNNTVVMGSFIIGLILLLPAYFAVKKFVVLYRERYEERIQKWKVVKLIKTSKVYEWYEKLKFLGE